LDNSNDFQQIICLVRLPILDFYNCLHFSAGALETSMLRGFLQRANLRRWLSRAGTDPLLKQAQELIDKLYGGATKDDDVHPQEMLDADTEALSRGTLLRAPEGLPTKSRIVSMRARFRADNIIYARQTTHLGNSLVLFYAGGNRGNSATPGSIEYIYEDEGTIQFAVRMYRRWDGRDPFARWPDFPAKLWSLQQYDRLEAVELSWIVSHFVQYPLGDQFVLGTNLQVVLALDQVCLSVTCIIIARLTVA
jgi:hypothetical protein